jgi:Rps23 Pro-64 3,4-dihydroxylase Tpa1-like proline 4-hydroxylase
MSFTVFVVLLSSTAVIRASTNVSQLYGNHINVIDGLFEPATLQALVDLVSKYNVWSFQYRDPFEDEQAYEALPAENSGNVDWLTWLDLQFFELTEVWRRLNEALITIGRNVQYRPYSVSAFLLRRLDRSTIAKDCARDERHDNVTEQEDRDFTINGDINIVIYLNKNWLKNDYGELLLYDELGEVAAAIIPKHGRVVIWNCVVPHLFRPPSVSFKQGQVGLIIRATVSAETHQRGIDQFETLQKFYLSHNLMDFALVDDRSVPNWNLSNHLTRKYTDKAGKLVVVYDNLLEKEELDELRSYLIAFHDTYHYQIHDESLEEDSDNVQWVAGLKNEEFVRSRVWTLTQRILQHATNRSDWYPYDVALNIIRGADYTRIHKDCDDYEDEMTLLIYLNPEYDVNYHGETAFFNEIESDMPVKPGNEEYELFAVVKPVYGRLCLFHGTIPHSARPPSTSFLGGRYTFAVKLSATPQLAKAKNLQEILEGGYSRDRRQLKSEELHNMLHVLRNGQRELHYHHLLPSVAFISEQIKVQTAILLEERHEKRNHAMIELRSGTA